MSSFKNSANFVIAILIFVGIVGIESVYDARALTNPKTSLNLSPQFFRTFDIGLHSALASFLWINTRAELPFLRDGLQKFKNDLNLINALDPKLSTPYAFSVLVLSNGGRGSNKKDIIDAAVEIGERGVRDAGNDWRISFYLAALYHLELKDEENAVKYFNIAAQTPQIPDVIRRFAVGYSILPTVREKTKQVWLVIYESSSDPDIKNNAGRQFLRLQRADDIQAGVKLYKNRYGEFPKTLDDLVKTNIVTVIPEDPLGIGFQLYDGGVVGIKEFQF